MRLAGLATGLTGLTGAAPAGLALGPRRIRDKKGGKGGEIHVESKTM